MGEVIIAVDQDIEDLRNLSKGFKEAFGWKDETDKTSRSFTGLLLRVADRLEKQSIEEAKD